MERVFTLEEATALLPRLSELLEELRTVIAELSEHSGGPQGHAPAGNGSAAAASGASHVERRYLELAAAIEATGVVLRDPSTGLVDFAATRDERPVYLCWRVGEPAIANWHPRDTGFAGRSPL